MTIHIPDPTQRAADVDRQAVATQLGEQMTAGRLTVAEYDERLIRAYKAQTFGQLAELTADLPTPTPAPVPAPVPVPSLIIPRRRSVLDSARAPFILGFPAGWLAMDVIQTDAPAVLVVLLVAVTLLTGVVVGRQWK